MHIYFIGQGLTERRLGALAVEALKNGHSVTIAHAGSKGNMSALGLQQARLLRIPSFDPTMPGGYLFSLLAVFASLFIKPNTIHVHGWKEAFFVRMLRPFLGSTPTILTVSSVPNTPRIARFIASGFDGMFSSNRTTQYRLLALYGLKTEYIPDGYHAPSLPDIRPTLLHLRKEGYGVILSQDAPQIRRILKACRSAKMTKKLVIFPPMPSIRGSVRVDAPLSSRSASSLIRQAAFVIATDSTYSPLLLQAMDAKRHIIATTDPIHEEVLGTTASYFEPKDLKQMAIAIKTTIKRKNAPSQASTRAKNHFSWEKIGQEYLRAYRHNKAVLVPFDSIIPRNSFQRAV